MEKLSISWPAAWLPRRLSSKEQAFFARRLSFLLGAGVPLNESLALVRDQTRSQAKAAFYDAMLFEIENGHFLGSAMRARFGDFAVAMITVGEASGTLAENLVHLAEELAKKHALRRKILSALIYPSIIAISTLLITALLISYIFPKVAPIFISLQVSLPLSTRIMIGVADFLSHFGFLLAIAIGSGILGVAMARKKFLLVRMFGDRLLLSLPLFGPLIQQYNLANCCRTLGLLLHNGVPIGEALRMSAAASQNMCYRASLELCSVKAERGERLSQSLGARSDLFPDLALHLIAIGEETGALPATLSYLAEGFESEVDERAKNLSSALEPALMLTMGLMVGFVAISIITPLYGITEHLQPH